MMKTSLARFATFALLTNGSAFATPSRDVALGQRVRVDGPTVRPIKLLEDSRCPANARCIWAGRVVVRAEARGGHWRRTIDLTLGDAGVAVADGRLRLVAVTPERSNRPIRPAAYRFAFEFQGGL